MFDRLREQIKNKGWRSVIKSEMFVCFAGVCSDYGDSFSTLDSVTERVKFIYNSAVVLSALVTVTMMIIAGYRLITSEGDPEKIEQGYHSIVSAVFGLVMVFIAALVIRFVVENVLKISL